jgi:acyl-CoA dehydrogenase
LAMSRAGVGALGTGAARALVERSVAAAEIPEHGGGRLIDKQWVQMTLAEMKMNVDFARGAYWEANFANALEGAFADLQKPVSYEFIKGIPASAAEAFAPLMTLHSTMKRLRAKRLKQAFVRHPVPALGSAAKISGSNAAMKNSFLTLKLFGAEALRHDFGIEKIIRDARLLQIYEGTNELNLMNVFKNQIAPEVAGVKIYE